MDVKDVRVGADDSANVPILNVYVKKAPYYAIYRTHERVVVHLADSAEERKRQQEILAALNPLRSEIQSLIDGWRKSDQHDKQAMTDLFDRRIADALAMALEGDPVSGQALLKSALDEISEERQSRGRIEHLYWSVASAFILVIAAVVLSRVTGGGGLDSDLGVLFFAGAVGAVGALVSIGIAIRERSLSTDLQTRDNIADAVLRVCVGAVGAVLLIAMLRSDFIDIEIGDVDLGAPGTRQEATADAGGNGSATAGGNTASAVPGAAGGNGSAAAENEAAADAGDAAGAGNAAANAAVPAQTEAAAGEPQGEEAARPEARTVDGDTTELLALLVIAFFAGFSERLVKQLAERIHFRDVAAAVPGAGMSPAGGPTRAARATAPGTAAAADAAAEEAGLEEEGEVDACVSDVELAEDETTDDSQLPPAEGGVEEGRA